MSSVESAQSAVSRSTGHDRGLRLRSLVRLVLLAATVFLFLGATALAVVSIWNPWNLAALRRITFYLALGVIGWIALMAVIAVVVSWRPPKGLRVGLWLGVLGVASLPFLAFGWYASTFGLTILESDASDRAVMATVQTQAGEVRFESVPVSWGYLVRESGPRGLLTREAIVRRGNGSWGGPTGARFVDDHTIEIEFTDGSVFKTTFDPTNLAPAEISNNA